MLTGEWFGAVCLLSLLIVAVAAVYRTLRGSKPGKPQTLLDQIAAVPSLRSVVILLIVTTIVSAAFFTWLAYQWHHGPVP
jgi:predicted MFS family arabinose efflux permease